MAIAAKGNKPAFHSGMAQSPPVDQTGVEERASRFTKRSIKKESKVDGLKMVLSMIDLTTLEGKDTVGKVKQLCYKAMHLHDALPGLPTVAAVCVYPSMVKTTVHPRRLLLSWLFHQTHIRILLHEIFRG